jgi:hypothetical protein
MSSLTELLDQQSVVLMEATIPVGMTVDEWRRRRLPPRYPTGVRRLGRPCRLS